MSGATKARLERGAEIAQAERMMAAVRVRFCLDIGRSVGRGLAIADLTDTGCSAPTHVEIGHMTYMPTVMT